MNKATLIQGEEDTGLPNPLTKNIKVSPRGLVKTSNTDAFSEPGGEVVPGSMAAVASGAVQNIITEAAASGYTQLLLKFYANGANTGFTNRPVIHYTVNSLDPATDLAAPNTSDRVLKFDSEVLFEFDRTDPMTNIDIKSIGITTDTLLSWEYR